MYIPITAVSDYARQFLERHKQGTVHSVYRKTVNFSLGGHLLALQAADSPLSPISLITPLTAREMEGLPIQTGDCVSISSGVIQIGKSCLFSSRHAVSAKLALSSSLSHEELSVLEQRIFSVLARRNAGSFELLFSQPQKACEIPFLAIAQSHLLSVSQALLLSDWKESARRLCRLMGLGLGLTPGGDDFLCGILAGLILCKIDRHPFSIILHETLTENLSNTNPISAAFLQCALEGQFSMAVCSLTAMPFPEEILTEFLKIGHSSGTDTLCGIAYILRNRALLT
ncbi:MAG TPA: DUF2877 domain-containing protein [Candidatus Egerieimonas intestinavium]|uniref:DUF2877 domain-containing protein n=1 Tax=Candidatus Egerieimonas intestinavium TaxID=2840777 RepID=A0A9D1JGU6_9FIRM|nr:DUF2877 domain-containing protein [Candidatus Egerieimonas intestinavium]